MSKPLDKNDAPEGHEAQESTFTCVGCAFYEDKNAACMAEHKCVPQLRADKRCVIFVKKPNQTN